MSGVAIGKKNMSNYSIIATDKSGKQTKYYPSVKYNFVKGEILQIHLYLDFVRKKSNGYPETLTEGDKKTISTWKTYFKNGVKEYWGGANIVGSKNDFNKNIKFYTEVVIHDKKKSKEENHNKAQNYITVYIGGECPGCTSDGDYWFHSHPYDGGVVSADGKYMNPKWQFHYKGFEVYMPLNSQLKTNKKAGQKKEKSVPEYKASAAHEMGHILGLDDAYTDDKGVVRLIKNDETVRKTDGNNHSNLMNGSLTYLGYKVLPNDIEMILNAYGLSVLRYKDESRDAFQSYNSYKQYYTYEVWRYLLSKRIKNTKNKYQY